MRLDKFLKVSRIIKRRTVANEVATLGRVFINGRNAKASTKLKESDEVTIEYANRTIKFEILKIPTGNVPAQEAKDLYKMIEDFPN